MGTFAEYLDYSGSTQEDTLHFSDAADLPPPRSYHCALDACRTEEPGGSVQYERKSKSEPVTWPAGCLFGWVIATVLNCSAGGLSVYYGDHCDAAREYDARG